MERGRPFIGVAAAKQSISSILDPTNTAQLEQQFASTNLPVAASPKCAPRASAGPDTLDVDKVLMRLSSSVSDPVDSSDPTDCMAILRSFQVSLGHVEVCSS